MQKPVPPPKPQTKSTDGAEKRKKEKLTKKYVATEEEIEPDKEVREVKKTSTYDRVVKKPQSGGAPLTKKPRAEAKPSSRARASKK